MKSRENYYVSRKNVLTWVAVILSVCAGVCHIANVTCGKGTGVSGAIIWLRVVLPVAAVLMFALVVALRGEDRLYRIAIPYWLFMISFGYGVTRAGLPLYGCILVLLVLLALCVLVTALISGRIKADWLLIPFAGIPLALTVWYWGGVFRKPFALLAWLPMLADGLFFLSYIVLCFAIKTRVKDGRYYPTWGDREDGRRLRTLPPMSMVETYIMPNRSGASNLFHGSVEITALEKYIRQKKLSGYDGFGITEVFLAACVRTIAQYPAINRFVSGQKVYSRDEDIVFCMVIKKEMTTQAPDTIIKLHLTPRDTSKDVYEKFHTAVEEVRRSSALDSEFDGVAKIFSCLPGILLKFAIWFLKLLDYFGLMPKALMEISPFHSTVFFTSMGSLGISSIYHHLYDFGNLPMFCAFGCKYRKKETRDDGSTVEHKYIDYTFVLDDRTVDGFYYASAIKYFQKLLLHPERLDVPPDEVLHDIP